jgi:hypothetical protein
MSRKTESLTTQKSSRKLFPKMTEGILSAHAPVDSENVKENCVADHSEIVTKLFPEMIEGILRAHNTC